MIIFCKTVFKNNLILGIFLNSIINILQLGNPLKYIKTEL